MSTPAQDDYAVSQGCYFDDAAADRVRSFFRFLRHSKGEFAGRPFELLAWQWEQVIRPLFGWKRADGTRRYRRAYIEIPKKNGKSTICAGLALYLAIADREPGAQVYIAAADRRQASIVYNECKAMAQTSPALAGRVEVIDSKKKLVGANSSAEWFIEALSAEAGTKEGFDISALIFDELHAQKSRKLWDTLTYGGAARRQPLLIAITTAGYDRQSICYEQHLYARGILEGTHIDPSFFAYIAAASPEDDWTLESTWRKANPSYGVTIREDQFAEDARQAQISPVKQNAFKRYRLNLWTDQHTLAIPMDVWRACGEPFNGTYGPSITDAIAGLDCYAGIDLASTTDINALCLYFPALHAVLPFFWVPAEACQERERLLKTRLDPWIAAGLIQTVPGAVMEYGPIKEKLVELSKTYRIRKVVLDRWNATAFAASLKKEFDVFFHGQGFTAMNEATKATLALVLSKKLRHGGNPVLAWMASNFAVETNAGGDLRPSKKRSGDKIDGIVALIMAVGQAQLAGTGKSVYEKKAIETI